MQFFSLAIGLVSLLTVQARQKEDQITVTSVVGAHGKDFDDFWLTNQANAPHARISKITIGPCGPEPVTYLKVEYKPLMLGPNAPPTGFAEHGNLYAGAKTAVLDFGPNDYLDKVNFHVSKVYKGTKWKTRIVELGFRLAAGKYIACGAQDPAKAPEHWIVPQGQAILYFSGGQGDLVDRLQGHMIPLEDYF